MKQSVPLFALLFAFAASAETLKVQWDPATGPVAWYVVEQFIVHPDATIDDWTELQPPTKWTTTETTPADYQDGTQQQFRVYAVDLDGRAGPRSEPSVPYPIGTPAAVVITEPLHVIVIPSTP